MNRRIRSIHLLLAVGVLILGGSAAARGAVVPRADHQPQASVFDSCGGFPEARFWEDNGFGGNSLVDVCYGDDISNLANVPAPNGCDAGWIIFGDWHDCISSFKVINANCHYKLRVYVNANYGSIMPSPYTQFGSHNESNMYSYNDTMSSLRWAYQPTCVD